MPLPDTKLRSIKPSEKNIKLFSGGNLIEGNMKIKLVFIFLFGVFSSHLLSYAQDFNAYWKLPFLPFKIIINKNGIDISGETSFVTPIGTFGIEASYDLLNFTDRPHVIKDIIINETDLILTIRDRNKWGDKVYSIKDGEEFIAVMDGKTIISAKKGQLLIDVTDSDIKELQFKGITVHQRNNDYVDSETYILNIMAVKDEAVARTEVKRLRAQGYEAGYLWIPDYNSLSRKEFFSVFIGPFRTQFECEVATDKYRKINPQAYGLLVSHKHKRVEIRGINTIKIIENYYR